MLHTFFLKPFNLLSTLISLLSNQEVLPLSPSNPKRTTPSTFFLVKTNSLQGLPQRLHLYNIYYHLGGLQHTLSIYRLFIRSSPKYASRDNPSFWIKSLSK
ncbi:hypothetical protein GIB67_023212 [Kingdonia uniflora]|uniref:Uncharacterized protein n=1 Tax=Kingdonia uniflora TaxID=39325 RepID=A0A7J7L9B9_9MAGN|nr:hypothetical protein GIB67_023212 [Kingdonia uniflora]